jgi:MSHA biogenesis protein MshO
VNRSSIHARQNGVTLIELVLVIAITGAIAAVVAIFIRKPIEGYVDTVRRAEMTDKADMALRRIKRDLRLALPNSVRVRTSGGATYLEFLVTAGGGRYRADVRGDTGAGDVLDFTAADDKFDVLTDMPSFSGGGTKYIVVANLYSDPTISTANAYDGSHRATYASNTGTTITVSPSFQFPYQSPGKRFQVVTGAVMYACTGTGEIRRYSGHTIELTPPLPPVTGANALLVDGLTLVTGCTFTYDPSIGARTGLVSMRIELDGGSGETVALFQQVHVINTP